MEPEPAEIEDAKLQSVAQQEFRKRKRELVFAQIEELASMAKRLKEDA